MDKPIDPDPASVDDPAMIRNVDGDPIPTLAGGSVVLRPLRDDDRGALLAVLQDPTVVAVWDSRGAANSVNELFAGDKNWTVWAIEVDGEFAGSIQAAENDDDDYKGAGIDIFMSSRFQGRGLGTDAVRTLARYLIEVRGHHRLTIDPAADNARAIRTYEKVGFKPVGRMRAYERGRDGTYHDGLLMDMLPDELR
jgi:aminoglycoside 6'-N-acetyltransferase